jgi:hypothetical protein
VAERSKVRVCGRSLAGIAGSNPGGDDGYLSLVNVVCLSGSGLCSGPISRPEESYRLWCVIVCEVAVACVGLLRQEGRRGIRVIRLRAKCRFLLTSHVCLQCVVRYRP